MIAEEGNAPPVQLFKLTPGNREPLLIRSFSPRGGEGKVEGEIGTKVNGRKGLAVKEPIDGPARGD